MKKANNCNIRWRSISIGYNEKRNQSIIDSTTTVDTLLQPPLEDGDNVSNTLIQWLDQASFLRQH
jgi:hypothetical protein